MKSRLFAVLSVAVVLRVAVAILFLNDPANAQSSDSVGYLLFGRHFGEALHGNGAFAELTVFRTPGYPALVALLQPLGDVRALIAAGAVLSLAIVWLTYELGRRVFTPTVGLVAASLVAVDPVSIFHAPRVLTETLSTFLVLAALLLWAIGAQNQDWRLFAAAGLLLGAAALVRPMFLYLPIVLAVIALVTRKRALVPVLMVVLAIVPPTIWLVRNHHVAHGWVYSSVQATVLFDYRAAGALAEDEHVTRETALAELLREYPPVPGETIAHRVSVEQNAAIHVLADHPVGAVKSTAGGVVRMLVSPVPWSDPATAGIYFTFALYYTAAAWGFPLAFGTLVLAIAGIVLVLRRGRRSKLTLLPLVLLIYTFVLSAGPEASDSRFRVPLLPLMALFAGLAVTAAAQRILDRRARGLAPP